MRSTLPAWFHRLGTPRSAFSFVSSVWLWFTGLGAVVTVIGLTLGVAFAPEDAIQGHSFRIIYWHVPLAAIGQGSMVSLALCGLVQHVWRMRACSAYARAIAPVGGWAMTLALVTGAIWGVPTWGTAWRWDGRVASALVMCLVYVSWIAASKSARRPAADRMCAVIATIGVINIPVIRYSVEWWESLHQTATFSVTGKAAMPPAMWLPLLVTLVGGATLSAGLVCLRSQSQLLDLDRQRRWTWEVSRV